MRKLLLSLLTFAIALAASHAEPFEIKNGDRVLFLGDTLLEREGTYGYLETRMVEQFPDRKFTVRNLAFSADTPLGWSRASFDPAAKGFERLKEQLALVKPTVVFLGYGMAASLQEMTDRSQDWTLNRDPARYGAEPMSAARFKKELAQCMDAINEAAPKWGWGEAIYNPNLTADAKSVPVRFVLLSPIRHEDLRATRPGLPDPTEHNKLLAQYSKAIEELAKERGALFVSLKDVRSNKWQTGTVLGPDNNFHEVMTWRQATDNGIHLTEEGYRFPLDFEVSHQLYGILTGGVSDDARTAALRAAIIRKNALFFHRWRPANETYLFGFRKREQGQNAIEIPKFDPLIEAAEAEIEKLKKAPKGASAVPADDGGVFGKHSAVSYNQRAMSDDHRATSDDRGAMSDDRGAMSDDRGAMSDDHKAVSDDHKAVSDDRGAVSDDHKPSIADHKPSIADHKALIDDHGALIDDHRPLIDGRDAASHQEMAKFQPKTAVLTSTGQLYAANDTPAAGNQPPVTSPDLSRQTPAETPDLSKVAASPSTLPLPTFTLADGLEISLWAENPLLAKPTQCNWDAQGRLWVASSAMYPQIAPGQVAFDKILVIEDPGHTGKATKATVFADGLLIPTGVAPVLTPEGHWGCYVGQSTEILYFEDTDGDGKADKKRIVFSGFGTEDTHHIVHTLRWGPDGRLYFSQSVYIHTHMETPWGVVRVNSGGVFAYDPRTERVEVVEKGLWNTWGHAWDKWGQSFYTDGAGSTGLSWGFPGATFAPNEGARRTMASISPGSYPKFAGLELIYSPHFPAEWQGSAVTCDFRAHKIVHFKITDLGLNAETQRRGEEGNGTVPATAVTPRAAIPPSPSSSSLRLSVSALKSGYTTEQLPVLVQTSDATFRPIDVKLGPDGALYIADWSNPIINHGEVDFRDPRRDHEHGRIWRLSMKGGAAVKWSDLNKLSGKELIQQMESGSLWAVSNARQMLAERSGRAVPVGASKEMQRMEEAGDALGQWLHDSWALKEPAKSLVHLELFWIEEHLHRNMGGPVYLFDAAPGARAIAARYIERLHETTELEKSLMGRAPQTVSPPTQKQMEAGQAAVEAARKKVPNVKSVLATDLSPRVRVEAMRALARIPTLESASAILDAAINAPKDDPQYEFAAWLSINDLAEVWTKAVLAGEWKPAGREKQFEFALNAIEPALAGQVLSQFVSTGRAPLDGSGPWIELIGNTGGPGELRPLLDGLLAATTPDGDKMKPLADAKWKFKMPGANARAAAALVAAARRGVKPAGDAAGEIAPWQLYMYAPNDALPDVLRLAGLWKQDFPAAIIATVDGETSVPVLDAAFEALRTLGTPKAVDFLNACLEPALEKKLDSPFLRSVLEHMDNGKRRRALAALAPLRPNVAMKHLLAVMQETPERDQPQLWRDLFASAPFLQNFTQKIPDGLPPASYISALRVAREMGRKAQPLATKLAPLVGEKAPSAAPADYNELAARAKKDGDPVAGEAIYRRMASACTTCHAIGGAGGKLGPDMTSIGASAPPDYIIESILNPAAKVKEGYHAFSFTMKDGTEAIGIPSRETPQEQFIRTLAGEQGLPKANIVSKKIAEGGASLMPVGLTAAWTDRERLNLYAFLMELGRPGPFDASKNNVARVWQLTDSGPTDGALKAEAPASTPSTPTIASIPTYTLVDGRLTKDLLAEKLAMLAPKNAAVHLTARFQAATAGKAKLNLTGIRKAWIDGQPLAIASEPSPSVDLTAGAHTFTVEVDAKSPPDVLRLESPAASFLGD